MEAQYNSSIEKRHSRILKIATRILIACVLTMTFSLARPYNAMTETLERNKLIEEAKKEGKVVVYASLSGMELQVLKSAFEKKYPFIKFDFYRAGKDRLLVKYMTEVRSGKFIPDIYQTSVFPLTTLEQKGLLAKYLSPERTAFPEGLKDKQGYWTALYVNAMTIAYNTHMVKPADVPKSYQDLLRPRWKGKMGLDLNKTEWYVAMLQMMGEDKGRKYMTDLTKQNVQGRNGNTLVSQLLTAGEFPLAVSLYPTRVEELKKIGAPVDWVPLEPHFVYCIGLALTAKNSHPAAAKLFIDFALSQEGQLALKAVSRITARNDVLPDPPGLIQGHKLLVVNPISEEDYSRYNKEYHSYFQ